MPKIRIPSASTGPAAWKLLFAVFPGSGSIFFYWILPRCPRDFEQHGFELWRFPAVTLIAIYLHIFRQTLTCSEKPSHSFSLAPCARRSLRRGDGDSVDLRAQGANEKE